MHTRYFGFIRLLKVIILFSLYHQLHAQSLAPKHEFRGVWVATVHNMDWPSSQGLTTEEQQKAFKKLVALQKQLGMNAIIMQIRPNADAFYPSPYEPWSQWLTGRQGKAPMPFYDPLDFMIRECKANQMEFHAWFNPYRAVVDVEKTLVDSTHIAKRKPEWVVSYGEHLYLDPGIPEVRRYTIQVIMDVVNKYDIDAVHFDDYFYPYRIDSLPFPDSITYQLYGKDFSDKDDWRRNNIDLLIHELSDSIRSVKPDVKFGISPFGVWRNQEDDMDGSATRAGQTCYDDLYADVLKWLRNDWIDYVAPQLYFSIGYEPADYEVLLDWWSRHTFGKQLYIGQGAYKIANNQDQRWENPAQLPEQIQLNRLNEQVDGSIFFSASVFNHNPLGLNDSLQQHAYAHPAIIPAMSWKSGQLLSVPTGLKAARHKHEILLQWDKNPHEEVAYYVIYAFPGPEVKNMDLGKFIKATATQAHVHFKEGKGGLFRKKHAIVITAVDRNHHESYPSEAVMIRYHP